VGTAAPTAAPTVATTGTTRARRRGGGLPRRRTGAALSAVAPAQERLSRQDATHVVRRLGSMLRDRRGELAVATAAVVGQTLCMLAGPWLVKRGVDAGLIGRDAGALNVAAVLYLVAAFLGLLFGRWAIWLVNRVGERFLRDLRVRAFRHVLGLGMDFYEREPTGRIVSRLTSDIDIMEQLVSQGLVMFVQNGLLLVGAVVVIFAMSWPLALCTLVIVPPVVWATRWFQRTSSVAYVAVRERIGENLTTLQEGLEGVRVVQAFNRERGFISKFRRTNEAQYEANLEAVRISVRYFPVIELAGVAGIAVIVGMGAWFVDRGTITVGVVLAFVLYLNNLFEPIQQLGQLYNTVQQSGAGLHKILVLLDTPCSVPEPATAWSCRAVASSRFERVVRLRRRGHPRHDGVVHPAGPDVLGGVDLAVAPGERLALVGPTAPVSRPSPSSWSASTTRAGERSASVGSTCATPPPPACATGSSWCPRRGSSSPARSATTGRWDGPSPFAPRSTERSRGSG